jgi:hypothetical protein
LTPPTSPTTKTCPDGSVIDASANCPTQSTSPSTSGGTPPSNNPSPPSSNNNGSGGSGSGSGGGSTPSQPEVYLGLRYKWLIVIGKPEFYFI